jgi:putative hydrolase of the HAD superfamily
VIRAALFDFGGVFVAAPFAAFAAYERENGLPPDLLRQVNAANPHDNAWARLERGEVDIDGFAELFEAEVAALGYEVDGRAVIGLLGHGPEREGFYPEMVEALRRCAGRLKTALLTNNISAIGAERGGGGLADGYAEAGDGPFAEVLSLFDVVIESSRVGVRKPDPRFYEMACRALAIEPSEGVFLDDLGINLKPAREMGMTTIKVVDPAQAVADLEAVVGFPLR